MHIVLGGTHGIGWAYAKYQARRGETIVLVARDSNWLERRANQLFEIGGVRPEVRAADLTNPEDLQRVLSSLMSDSLSSILIGGPSPPVGTINQVQPDDHVLAAKICLAYPHTVLAWAQRVAKRQLPVYVVSSASVNASLKSTPFVLSALYRRILEDLCDLFSSLAPRLHIAIWHPDVVLTRLSAREAGLGPSYDPEQQVDHHQLSHLVAKCFSREHIPTAESFVEGQMAGCSNP